MARTASNPPADDEGSVPATGRETRAAVLGKRGAAAFVTPAFVLVGIFLIFPALWTIYLGLTNYRLTGLAAAQPQFVGLENYAEALSDPRFFNSLWVTILFVLGSAIFGQAVLGFLLAWAMRGWKSRLRGAVELLVIVAWIMPSSVVAFLWIALLDGRSGTLNTLIGSDTEWLIRNPLLSIIVFNIWRGTAFSMLLFGAALGSLPPSYLETARLAGASTWQQLRDIVLPSIRGHILTTLLLISLWTFNDFTPFLITGGGPRNQTEVLPIFVFREALGTFQFGYGAAISTIMLAINLTVAIFYLRLLRERAR